MTAVHAGSEAVLRDALRQVLEIVEAHSTQGGQLALNEEGLRRMARARQLLGMPSTNPWKDAVLDRLAETCMDAPIDMPPSEILGKVITWHIEVERYFAAESLGILNPSRMMAPDTARAAHA